MTTRNPTTLMAIPTEETFDFLFKIVLIGDCGTGKTCIVQRFKNGTFIERHGNTIGVDFSMKTVIVDVARWVEEVRRYSGSSVLLALVGNKADMETLREVEFEEAEVMCQYMPEVLFVLEASAKDNSNIEEAFLCLATELKRRHDNGMLGNDDDDTVKLGDSRAVSKCSSCTQKIF
ncbi:Rab-43-like protein [Asbolus verrucosus]|uniref:Rab-43-like protein n=1 Tax=Asbolus verrucosus TaxID=1661398 RepID=A0A482VDH0_ASBVE|nr:Rab-43-like protein [Asbolus verrucosus]